MIALFIANERDYNTNVSQAVMHMQLRPAQEAILQYQNSRMAVSAVPGSGKTFTLALLAAQLIAGGYAGENRGFNPRENQQVMIVTYLNASVDTFKSRVRKQLEAMALPPDHGYEVRTLHSLALEIVRLSESGLGPDSNEPAVVDDTQRSLFLSVAVDGWIKAHPELWHAFLGDNSPQARARWRGISERTAVSFIRAAKNERYHSYEIQGRIAELEAEAAQGEQPELPVSSSPLLQMMAGIYGRYESILLRQGAMDFDDLIWLATDLLKARPDLAHELRRRWPYVLEDEAQDSVPLQEILLARLTGAGGNWVRVGDPNQAITSTFTAAHPRFFNRFLDRDDVLDRPLPNSGRSAPMIIGAANAVLDWVIDEHPVSEVRQYTFRRQHILPTPPGDGQPNPPDSEAKIRIKVYKHREHEELPAITQLAMEHVQRYPEQTTAILVPTHNLGHKISEILDEAEASYDSLLRGGTREREVAAAMHAILAILANPLDTKALSAAYAGLYELNHPEITAREEELARIQTILTSVHRPETLLFPRTLEEVALALPQGIATEQEKRHIERFAAFLQELFALRLLPVDDLALALGDELFAHSDAHEADLAIAYQIANMLRYWREMQPDWRLPELAAELASVASGQRRMLVAKPSDYGFEPRPGRITLATQHGAKGLEWDAVFLLGIDGFWIPGTLDAPFLGEHEFLGGDPVAEVNAQLRYLMQGDAGLYKGRTATESIHIDVISERLRLLYVGITRARRRLYVSRSRSTRQYNKERASSPASVLGVLYQYLKQQG